MFDAFSWVSLLLSLLEGDRWSACLLFSFWQGGSGAGGGLADRAQVYENPWAALQFLDSYPLFFILTLNLL